MTKEFKNLVAMCLFSLFMFVVAVSIVWGICALSSKYSIWSESQHGQAELSKAEFTRKISIREAEAKMESSKMLALAEVERAKGVAEANKIIGESLKNNEAYLRYLWVDGLQHTQNQVVYVPTEASLPILESGKR